MFVVAAHPDDDVIGCGGLMWRIARDGGTVTVAYLTDGSKSHPGSRRFGAAAIAAIRAAEAVAALGHLGIATRPSFFALPDGSLRDVAMQKRTTTIERLAAEIAAFDPDLVLAPWSRDPHPDHIAASAIARSAVASSARPVPFAMYEVWLPIRGAAEDHPLPGEVRTVTIELDAIGVLRKRNAILAHASQTSDLISDDPDAFRITSAMIHTWTTNIERLHYRSP